MIPSNTTRNMVECRKNNFYCCSRRSLLLLEKEIFSGCLSCFLPGWTLNSTSTRPVLIYCSPELPKRELGKHKKKNDKWSSTWLYIVELNFSLIIAPSSVIIMLCCVWVWALSKHELSRCGNVGLREGESEIEFLCFTSIKKPFKSRPARLLNPFKSHVGERVWTIKI